MKQVLQPYGGERLVVADVPAPGIQPGALLVANRASLISSGTERSSVSLAQKSLASKAAARPDLVRKVLDTARRDGVAETLQIVRGRLAADAALGYSAAGQVIGVGSGVAGFAVGARVACAGQDHASHAEVISVPERLCVAIPDGVSESEASFVAVGGIALQGVRQAEPALGEYVAVVGLGLVGQLVVRLLAANGVRVLATDLSADRCALAQKVPGVQARPDGFEDCCVRETEGKGVDAAIITAASSSSAPVKLGVDVLRKRGRLIVVGDVSLSLQREALYLKELELRLSTSYGPGRYDDDYELKGIDYPYAYVRWTEQRNMQAFLQLIADRRLDVEDLVSARYAISDAVAAYDRLAKSIPTDVAMLLEYPEQNANQAPAQTVSLPVGSRRSGTISIGVVGAGNHVKDRLLPQLSRLQGASIDWICGRSGARSANVARQFGAAHATTDLSELLADSNVDAVIVGTRHDTHAELATRCLEAGKHVYLEKPLCITHEQLIEIEKSVQTAWLERGVSLMVGYNRRYSMHLEKLQDLFGGTQVDMYYRVNAPVLPSAHWLLDPLQGGGRLVGEGCHFIDAMSAVCASEVVSVCGASGDEHSFQVLIEFANGSRGTLSYSTQGSLLLDKEWFEIHGSGQSARLENFVRTRFWSTHRRTSYKSRGRDMGFTGALAAFESQVTSPDEQVVERFESAVAVTRATLLAREILAENSVSSAMSTGHPCRA